MKCEETPAIVIDRLKGLSSAADEQSLEQHLATCAACRDEAKATAEIWQNLGVGEEAVPTDRLRVRFHAGLAAHEANAAQPWSARLARWWPQQPAFQAAFAASLLLIGLLVGQRWPSAPNPEIAALRDEVRTMGLAMLDHQSASERLAGVEWSRRATSTPEIVNALLERVRYDDNLSVRLAAVDALRTQLDRANVSAGLVAALERPEEPLLQVALADALLATGDDTAIQAVRAVLDRDGVDPTVRDYVQMALNELGADTTPAI